MAEPLPGEGEGPEVSLVALLSGFDPRSLSGPGSDPVGPVPCGSSVGRGRGSEELGDRAGEGAWEGIWA